ncbi:MAG: IS1 family transposase [Sediminibacterium sp.]|jgi:insertion element IS1 protein InsB|nr:IS1 family transposase [Chitinophagaceae bacterium]MCA6445693.1 IS1 family transposase [Chitinophagaceae bacterium]
MQCQFCNGLCIKAGKQKDGTQKLYCKACKKYQQKVYQYQACKESIVKLIPSLMCESVSIRGIARILKIATSTVQRKIILIASKIKKPPIPMNIEVVEMDELRTYIGNKANQYWVAYALCSKTKKILDFIVGKRSKIMLEACVKIYFWRY